MTKKTKKFWCINISVLNKAFSFRWYFRKIKRMEAEKKLLLPENEHGAFLIRDSESRHNDYSLSGNIFNMFIFIYRFQSFDNKFSKFFLYCTLVRAILDSYLPKIGIELQMLIGSQKLILY